MDQVTDNFIIMKNKFQLLKAWKNVVKKSGKNYSEKAFI